MDENLLLSIRRPYSQFILSGIKKFELRKRYPKRNCACALIYETAPTKSVIGHFEIKGIIHDRKENIMRMVEGKSCVTESFFHEYYKNSDFAVAIEIGAAKKFETPICLGAIGVNFVPQDFAYVKSSALKSIREIIV